MSQLNEKQVAALNFVISGHNLLILSPARTGRSFLVREIVGKCIEKGIRVSLTCTTGIACAVYTKIHHVFFNILKSIHLLRLWSFAIFFSQFHESPY